MQNVDDLKNILARLKPELISTDGDISTADGATPLAPAPDPEPTPEFQPENDYPAEDVKIFRPWRLIGSDPYDESFFAVPRARWPNPGGILTDEVKQAYDQEMNLCINAGSHLRRYFDWLRGPKRYLAALPPVTVGEPHYLVYDRQRYSDAAESAAQDLAWLKGVWETKGISVLANEELERMKTAKKD